VRDDFGNTIELFKSDLEVQQAHQSVAVSLKFAKAG